MTDSAPPPTEHPPTITVRGQGAVFAKVDRILLRIDLDRTGGDVESVEQRLTKDRKSVADALTEAGVPSRRIRSHGLQILPWHEWEKDRNVFKGFRGRETINVRVPHKPGLGIELVRALAHVLEHIRINVSFTVRDVTEARRKALEEAVADARTKAEIISNAAGCRLGRIREIKNDYSDRGLRGIDSSTWLQNPRNNKDDELAAIDQEVSATVTGIWEIAETR